MKKSYYMYYVSWRTGDKSHVIIVILLMNIHHLYMNISWTKQCNNKHVKKVIYIAIVSFLKLSPFSRFVSIFLIHVLEITVCTELHNILKLFLWLQSALTWVCWCAVYVYIFFLFFFSRLWNLSKTFIFIEQLFFLYSLISWNVQFVHSNFIYQGYAIIDQCLLNFCNTFKLLLSFAI